jgi:steroid 5-alpha reductase family enzyme
MDLVLWITFWLVVVASGLSVWSVFLVRSLERENQRLTEFIEWYVNAQEKYGYYKRKVDYYD